jgi:hypothetical protein
MKNKDFSFYIKIILYICNEYNPLRSYAIALTGCPTVRFVPVSYRTDTYNINIVYQVALPINRQATKVPVLQVLQGGYFLKSPF